MAAGASRGLVRSLEREFGFGMIERFQFPPLSGVMAAFAGEAQGVGGRRQALRFDFVWIHVAASATLVAEVILARGIGLSRGRKGYRQRFVAFGAGDG